MYISIYIPFPNRLWPHPEFAAADDYLLILCKRRDRPWYLAEYAAKTGIIPFLQGLSKAPKPAN